MERQTFFHPGNHRRMDLPGFAQATFPLRTFGRSKMSQTGLATQNLTSRSDLEAFRH
jgi:hypothetical protein